MKRINPYRLFKGAFIPNAILKYKGLLPMEKLMWARLSQYAGEDGRCFPSYSSLAEELSISDRYAVTLVNSLVEKKFIEKEVKKDKDGDHSSNHYFFLWHSAFDEDFCSTDQKLMIHRSEGGSDSGITLRYNKNEDKKEETSEPVFTILTDSKETRNTKTISQSIRKGNDTSRLSATNSAEKLMEKNKLSVMDICTLYRLLVHSNHGVILSTMPTLKEQYTIKSIVPKIESAGIDIKSFISECVLKWLPMKKYLGIKDESRFPSLNQIMYFYKRIIEIINNPTELTELWGKERIITDVKDLPKDHPNYEEMKLLLKKLGKVQIVERGTSVNSAT